MENTNKFYQTAYFLSLPEMVEVLETLGSQQPGSFLWQIISPGRCSNNGVMGIKKMRKYRKMTKWNLALSLSPPPPHSLLCLTLLNSSSSGPFICNNTVMGIKKRDT